MARLVVGVVGSAVDLAADMNETITIAAHEVELAPAIAPDLSPEQRQQVLVIAVGLERDIGDVLAVTFAAADELKIERHVVATAISLNSLMLAAHLHAGSESSFLEMAKQALALGRTGSEVQ